MDLTLYDEIAMVRNMRAPQVTMNVEGLCALQGAGAAPSWKSVSRPFLSAMWKIAGFHRLRFMIGLAWKHRLAGTDTLEMRIEHPASTWRGTALGKCQPGVHKTVVVEPWGETRLAPCELSDFVTRRRPL